MLQPNMLLLCNNTEAIETSLSHYCEVLLRIQYTVLAAIDYIEGFFYDF